jgi:hypothetical protein
MKISGFPLWGSLNKYSRGIHWIKTNDKSKYTIAAQQVLEGAGLKEGFAFPFKIHCDISMYFKTRCRRDDDNYVPKFWKDAIIGYLVADDSPLYMSWHLKDFGLLKDKDNPRVDVEIRKA